MDALDADGCTPIKRVAMRSQDKEVVVLLQWYETMLRCAVLLRSSGLGLPRVAMTVDVLSSRKTRGSP